MSRALIAAALVACSSPAAPPPSKPAPAIAPAAPGKLLAPAAFDAIEDRRARSQALFGEIGRVLAHPRCVNCHPADDTPRQGDAHAFHDPPVLRGLTGRGVPAMQCGTCHQERNAELARLPGAPNWQLAPRSMAWLGKTVPEICMQLGDSARNGGRTLPQILDHLAHDGIVAWGWAPGADRVPAPGTQAELAALFAAWLDTGAVCP